MRCETGAPRAFCLREPVYSGGRAKWRCKVNVPGNLQLLPTARQASIRELSYSSQQRIERETPRISLTGGVQTTVEPGQDATCQSTRGIRKPIGRHLSASEQHECSVTHHNLRGLLGGVVVGALILALVLVTFVWAIALNIMTLIPLSAAIGFVICGFLVWADRV